MLPNSEELSGWCAIWYFITTTLTVMQSDKCERMTNVRLDKQHSYIGRSLYLYIFHQTRSVSLSVRLSVCPICQPVFCPSAFLSVCLVHFEYLCVRHRMMISGYFCVLAYLSICVSVRCLLCMPVYLLLYLPIQLSACCLPASLSLVFISAYLFS